MNQPFYNFNFLSVILFILLASVVSPKEEGGKQVKKQKWKRGTGAEEKKDLQPKPTFFCFYDQNMTVKY